MLTNTQLYWPTLSDFITRSRTDPNNMFQQQLFNFFHGSGSIPV